VAVVPETAVAMQKTAIAKYGDYRGKQLAAIATINRLSKAEWCQHWLSPRNETATMTCKVKPSKKGQQSTC